MKNNILKKLIKKALKESNLLTEVEPCGWQTCTCEAGGSGVTTYQCKTLTLGANCDCCDSMADICTCYDSIVSPPINIQTGIANAMDKKGVETAIQVKGDALKACRDPRDIRTNLDNKQPLKEKGVYKTCPCPPDSDPADFNFQFFAKIQNHLTVLHL